MEKTEEILNKEIALVVARLETLSSKVGFASGNGITISRDEAIEHIKKHDEIGKEFLKVEMEFLRAIKTGELMKMLISE